MPSSVRYGQRYGDDSGWERRLEIDMQRDEGRVEIEMGGRECTMTWNDLQWLVAHAIAARTVLGFKDIPSSEHDEHPNAKT